MATSHEPPVARVPLGSRQACNSMVKNRECIFLIRIKFLCIMHFIRDGGEGGI
jgi:hypothetical protein